MNDTKRNKEAVHYTARADNTAERCKHCEHFTNSGTLYGECSKVKGNISPLGWCDLFKKKK